MRRSELLENNLSVQFGEFLFFFLNPLSSWGVNVQMVLFSHIKDRAIMSERRDLYSDRE